MDTIEATIDPLSALAHLARLAAAYAKPFATFDQRNWSFGSINSSEIKALGSDAAFVRPVERALALQLTGTSFNLTVDAAYKLTLSHEGRIAILLVSEPLERIEEAARLCAAAAMQQFVLRVVAKTARSRIRQALGANAYQVATREAPILYPSLAVFGSSRILGEILSEDVAPHQRLIAFGSGILLRLVSSVSPEMFIILERKLLIEPDAANLDNHEDHEFKPFVKLIRRRMPEWSVIID